MADVNITPSENGPYLVSGPVKLTDVDGREIPHPDQMALCRCGHSNNKPFCDGTHRLRPDGRAGGSDPRDGARRGWRNGLDAAVQSHRHHRLRGAR